MASHRRRLVPSPRDLREAIDFSNDPPSYVHDVGLNHVVKVLPREDTEVALQVFRLRQGIEGGRTLFFGRGDVDGGAAIEHPDGGPTLFFLREGLEVLDAPLRHTRAQGVILAFTVGDIEAEVARLTADGVATRSEIRQDDWGEKHVQLVDPNGFVLQLVQWVGERPY